MELKLHVKGTTPLLQHNAATMLDVGPAKTRAEKDLPPAQQAAKGVYLDKDGMFVHPTAAFRNAILTGGKEVKIGMSASSKYLAGAMILNPQPGVVLVDDDGDPLTEYEVHVATVKMPTSGGRVIRGWPKFNEWNVHLDCYIDDAMWPSDLETLERILGFAGKLAGVGDGRPEKRKLGFGQFEVSTTKV